MISWCQLSAVAKWYTNKIQYLCDTFWWYNLRWNVVVPSSASYPVIHWTRSLAAHLRHPFLWLGFLPAAMNRERVWAPFTRPARPGPASWSAILSTKAFEARIINWAQFTRGTFFFAQLWLLLHKSKAKSRGNVINSIETWDLRPEENWARCSRHELQNL